VTDNKIIVFENEDFGELRTVEIDGEVWFVGKDVAMILGYGNGKLKVRL
jgi:prophage antirepressor-like protein